MSSNKDGKDGNDVDALVAHLHLGTVRYREFGTPRSTVAATTAPSTAPVPPAATAPLVAVTPAAAAKAPTPITAVAAEDDGNGLRSVTGASPLAFTFERLRRQAIGTPMRKPYLALDLPERHAWRPGATPAPRQRLLTTIFAEMESAASANVQKRA